MQRPAAFSLHQLRAACSSRLDGHQFSMVKKASEQLSQFSIPHTVSHAYLVLRDRFCRRSVMSWSINIGTIAGTAVRIHITFVLFLGWIFFATYAAEGPEAALANLIFLILLFACVLAHEFGHIFTARAFGVATPDVTLLPIGGVARLERIPDAPHEEFLIAIAGPLVNVLIALGLIVLAGARLNAGDLTAMDSAKVWLVDRLAAVNLFLVLFNMIPAFPMDGGRVLRALLQRAWVMCGQPRLRRSLVKALPSSSDLSDYSTIRC